MQPLKFRSPDETVIHVASTSGHAARVGPDWRELHTVLHKDAIAAGCITSNMTEEAIAAAAKKTTAPNFSQEAEVRKAIVAMLEDDDKTNFTGAGLPNLTKLSARCGFGVDREMMQKVWADLRKESDSDAGNATGGEVQ